MPRRPVTGWLLVVVGLALAAGAVLLVLRPDGPRLQPWSPQGADPVQYAADLVAATNVARADEDLPPVTGSQCAQSHAQDRAQALAGGKELVHASLSPVIQDCAPSTTAAENLARAAATPHDVVQAWLASPGHRSNLLDPGLDQVGIGCLLDDGEMLCSQVFLGP